METSIWINDDEESNYSRCPVCGLANAQDRSLPYISRNARTSDTWCAHLLREEGEFHVYAVPCSEREKAFAEGRRQARAKAGLRFSGSQANARAFLLGARRESRLMDAAERRELNAALPAGIRLDRDGSIRMETK